MKKDGLEGYLLFFYCDILIAYKRSAIMTRDEIIQKLKKDENAEYTLRFEYENKKYVRAVKSNKNQLIDVYYEIKESELKEVKNQNLLDAFNAKYKHDANPILY